ncbi:MAG: pilus assembly protein TadG-related protein [Anaerolineae bacterium]|jgi:Tfp pilus assembly protein PilE
MHQEQQGQTLVLVAVALIVLVIFAAIAVDLSNGYVHRRTAQNAADAAALAGARELARQLNEFRTQPWRRNEFLIKAEMNDFAERNDIEDTNDSPGDSINTNVTGYFIDTAGEHVSEYVIGDVGSVPDAARGVEAIAHTVAPSFFSGVLGQDGFAISAESAVVFEGACADTCVMPIAAYTETFKTDECYNIYDGAEPGSFGWLNWQYGHEGDTCKCSATCLADNLDPLTCNSGRIEVGDFAASDSGISNKIQIRDQLEHYIDNNEPFTIIIYDYTECRNGKCDECAQWQSGAERGFAYHVIGFAKFQLIGYSLATGGGSGQAYGDDGESCLGPEPTGGNRLTGRFMDWVEGEAGDCVPYGGLIAPRVIK